MSPVVELPRDAIADSVDCESLIRALNAHGAVCIRGAQLDDPTLSDILDCLGPAMFTSGETAVENHPNLNVVTNAGRSTPPRSRFHTDSSYYMRPPAYTALRPVEVPEQGGATLFIDTRDAFDALPLVMRNRLRGRSVRHCVSGVDPEPGAETESWQPLFRLHPHSGCTALYITVPERMVEIEGLTPDETQPVIADLYAFATSRPQMRHDWQPGDFLVWDNRTTLHKGDHSGVVGRRTLHRGMAEGEVPILA